MARVLRPLRLVSRNKILKIALHALLKAIPSIFNVVIVSILFFLVFGIIGVNFFKGTFYSCTLDSTYPSNLQDLTVLSKFDCMNIGGSWLNADNTFDNTG